MRVCAGEVTSVVYIQKGAVGEGVWGLFYTNFFIPFTGVPCYKRIPEASQRPNKSAEPLSQFVSVECQLACAQTLRTSFYNAPI